MALDQAMTNLGQRSYDGLLQACGRASGSSVPTIRRAVQNQKRESDSTYAVVDNPLPTR